MLRISTQRLIRLHRLNFEDRIRFTSSHKNPTPENGLTDKSRSLENLSERYSDLENKLMAKMKSHNKLRFRTVALGSVLLILWSTNTFGKEIKRFVGGQTAEVARETLRHESIQIQTQELAMAVVNTLLTDSQVLHGTSRFLQIAANDPATKLD
mmetsp:Transcript_14808/g.21014  ORF Transcript_14808/g.21014 Transcript_14808/m.21014 type:complete len:154 (-) Transcript_14808:250-711(-)